MSKRGRHQTSCKEGKRTILLIEAIPGVSAVIIGMSLGGKSVGKNKSDGYLKLQREEESGFKAVLQTSKGVQEIFIMVEKELKPSVKKKIEEIFPK